MKKFKSCLALLLSLAMVLTLLPGTAFGSASEKESSGAVATVPGDAATDITDGDKTVDFYGADLETKIGSLAVAYGKTLEEYWLPDIYAPSGKVFAGWYTSKPTENGTKVAPGSKLDIHDQVLTDLSVYPVFVASGNKVIIENPDGTIVPCETLKAAIDGDTALASGECTVRLIKDVSIGTSDFKDYQISEGTCDWIAFEISKPSKLIIDLNEHSLTYNSLLYIASTYKPCIWISP